MSDQNVCSFLGSRSFVMKTAWKKVNSLPDDERLALSNSDFGKLVSEAWKEQKEQCGA